MPDIATPMTAKQALSILLTHAGNDCRGSGVGVRSRPTDAQIRQVVEAATVLMRRIEKREPHHRELEGYGIKT